MQSREMYVYMDKYTWGGKKNLLQIAKTNKQTNPWTNKQKKTNPKTRATSDTLSPGNYFHAVIAL